MDVKDTDALQLLLFTIINQWCASTSKLEPTKPKSLYLRTLCVAPSLDLSNYISKCSKPYALHSVHGCVRLLNKYYGCDDCPSTSAANITNIKDVHQLTHMLPKETNTTMSLWEFVFAHCVCVHSHTCAVCAFTTIPNLNVCTSAFTFTPWIHSVSHLATCFARVATVSNIHVVVLSRYSH